MPELKIHYPDDLFAASGKTTAALERDLSLAPAVQLFQAGELSLGRAAELAGCSRLDFMDQLSKAKIPVVNLDDEEINAEIDASRADYRRR